LSLPCDSIINASKVLLLRLSFFRPELGAEVKVFKPISFYNSIGINFNGNIFRNSQTFINYDYSSELRFFYRQTKRSEKGKSNYNFSGPFIAGTYTYLIDTNVENKNVIGIIHGWQESSLFNNTYGGFRVGLGYDLNTTKLTFRSLFTIGWTF
jgi:hypothetical protein